MALLGRMSLGVELIATFVARVVVRCEGGTEGRRLGVDAGREERD